MRLFELRKEPSKNVKKSTWSLMIKYAKNPDISISFSPIDKLGVHPKSRWETPNGVYAYPLKFFKEEILVSHPRDVVSIFPYGHNRPYIFVLQHNFKNPLILSKNIPDSDYYKFVDYIEKNAQVSKKIIEMVQEDAQKYSINSQKLIYILKMVTHYSHGNKATNIYNKLLRIFGFDAVIDDGTATLYGDDEPYQIVFLTPDSYKVVDRLHNDNLEREHRKSVYGSAPNANSLRVNATVEIINGEHKGKKGIIEAINNKTKMAEVFLMGTINFVEVPLSDLKLIAGNFE